MNCGWPEVVAGAAASAQSHVLWLGRTAVRSLYMELALEPKPGLVTLRDSGSHDDMDAGTFMRSLFALRGYFVQIALAGWHEEPFETLESLGRRAESRMLVATGGVNTHRGAIFGLGLLCASAGKVLAQRKPLSPAALRAALLSGWARALAERAERRRWVDPPASNGQKAARTHRLQSAGDEAAAGFPTLFSVTLPALRAARAAGAAERAARAQALLATIAVLEDTNLVHRGGLGGLRAAQRMACEFLDQGGTLQPDWVDKARAIHRAFVARRLSPGGAADLLGSACWVDVVCPDPQCVATKPVSPAVGAL